MSDSRVVLDTNILVSALLTPSGNPARILKMFLSGGITLVYCEEILLEYREVLYRFRPEISMDDVDIVLAAIMLHGELIEVVPSTGTMIDEDDRVFYDVAKTASAFLITGNKKHFPHESFILSPAQFFEP